jgi:hypothetical protein
VNDDDSDIFGPENRYPLKKCGAYHSEEREAAKAKDRFIRDFYGAELKKDREKDRRIDNKRNAKRRAGLRADERDRGE